MYKEKLFWAVLILLITGTAANAQRTWFDMEMTKDISKKFEISLCPAIRFKEGFDFNEYFLEPAVKYEFNKYFSLGANYRLGNNLDKNGDAHWYGRYALEAKTGYKWNQLEIQFRLRYTNFDDFSREKDQNLKYLRLKFQLEYEIRKFDLKPYTLYEFYRDLDEADFTKARWEGGLEYKINKHHRVGTYFRLNDYLTVDTESIKIIGVSYKLKL